MSDENHNKSTDCGLSPVGRPTIYTEELTARICARLAAGESLRAICKDKGIPSMSTILLWVVDGKHQDFSEQYMLAREAAGYAHGDRVADVAIRTEDGDIEPNAARVAMMGYQWAAERMAPKAHGSRQRVEHTSPDGSMSPGIDVTKLSPDVIEAILKAKDDSDSK